MLEVTGLHAFYGKSHVLHGVSFQVGRGEIVSLLGRNGVGRSTAIKAIMGLAKAEGSVRFKGQQLVGRQPHQIALCGVGYVPEDRAIFADLTVRQNLMLGIKSAAGAFGLRDAFALFPRLEERAEVPGGVLSGGEQQMLTLCRTMMGNPELLLVDEPTEGLAPQMVSQVARFLVEMQKRGISILMVEQKLAIALDVSQRLYILGHGRVVFSGTPADLQANAPIRREWLEV
jgi:branched-chain amino acid transport system ATP-binding protein